MLPDRGHAEEEHMWQEPPETLRSTFLEVNVHKLRERERDPLERERARERERDTHTHRDQTYMVDYSG